MVSPLEDPMFAIVKDWTAFNMEWQVKTEEQA